MNPEISQPAPADLCAQCHEGTYQSMTKDYTVELRDGDQCTIANLAQRKCNQCGHVVLPWPSVQRVDRAVADHTEPLTAEFLKQTRERLQPNMTLLAESLGLGSKTWMRWEKGEQNISRSMGYFVRAMARFPEVYEWVADRAWRYDNKAQQATTQRPCITIDEILMKVLSDTRAVKSRKAAELKENVIIGKRSLDEMYSQNITVSKKDRVYYRRGDIQYVDPRFAESMEAA